MAAKKTQAAEKAAAPQVAVENVPDQEALRNVTTDSASTAEDVALLAYKGESLPSGWSYNPRRGFFQSDAEVDPLKPIDDVGPNLMGAEAPSDPGTADGV